MKKFLLSIFLLAGISQVFFGQGEESSFTSTGRGGVATTFASDYEAIGLNPANLGMEPKYDGRNFSLGLAEFGLSVYTDALNKPGLKDMIRSTIYGKGDELTKEQKLSAAKDFIQSPLAANIDVLNIGFSGYSSIIGGVGFTVKDRISYYSTFNENFAEMLFTGYDASYFTHYIMSDGAQIAKENFESSGYSDSSIVKGAVDSAKSELISNLFDGTRLTMNWYKEFNVTYGRGFTINDGLKLYGGLGLKYVQGIASLDINFEGDQITDDSYAAFSAGIPVNYGGLSNSGASNLDTTNNGLFGLPEAIGSGLGVDLGFNVLLGEWDFGIAITDLGSVNYKKNVYSVKDVRLQDLGSDGMNSYNILQGAADFTADEGAVDWTNIESKKVSLPTVMRVGASFTHKITEDRKVEFGGDLVIPMTGGYVAGGYRAPLLGLGGDISLIKWLNVSSGIVTGGNYGSSINVPMGVTVDIANGMYEFGIATRDILYYFTDSTPTVSMSMGFLRFRI